MSFIDLTGQKFGRWTVVAEAEKDPSIISRSKRWLCQCECGTRRVVSANSLMSGRSLSCGCYHSEIMRDVGATNATHGLSSSRLYAIFKHMNNRCSNPNDIRYEEYGGRGIRVCDEWASFGAFAEWALTHGYRDTLSIDRIDVNGDYCPDNCRWSTPKEQAINRRSSVLYEYNGQTHCISEWAEIFGMNYTKLWKRLHNGWDIAKALTT